MMRGASRRQTERKPHCCETGRRYQEPETVRRHIVNRPRCNRYSRLTLKRARQDGTNSTLTLAHAWRVPEGGSIPTLIVTRPRVHSSIIPARSRKYRCAALRYDKPSGKPNHAQQDRVHWPQRPAHASHAAPRPRADRQGDRRCDRRLDTEQGDCAGRNSPGPRAA